MIKQTISYFIPCILSLTFVYGCINYTNTETQDSASTLVIEDQQEKAPASIYIDYRKSIKDVSQENNVTSSIDTLTRVKKEECPTILYLGYEVMYDPKYKIPKWVKYELMSTETDGPYSRKGLNFCQDPSANVPQADDYDYKIQDGRKATWLLLPISNGVVKQ